MLAHAEEKPVNKNAEIKRWTEERANQWYSEQLWLVGCNFIPSTAINQLEMWQEDTFDEKTIKKELRWASELGMNTVRVYLHDLAWEADPKGFKKRIDKFLKIAGKQGIKPMFVIFDDCWNTDPKIGKQPEPKPGIHNSGWLQSPGKAVVNDQKQWDRLERYVKDILTEFGEDKRILLWDLYNEPGNEGQGSKSIPLVKKVFEWARDVDPIQPLSIGVWNGHKELNAIHLSYSDVITFHHYGNVGGLPGSIARFKQQGRPVICTEWLNRRNRETVFKQLPIFKKENVGCYNWGLVSGKTQTIYPWGSKPNAPEPKVWFHDLLRKDGTPLDPREASLFRELTDRK
jgi:hypothetical protein